MPQVYGAEELALIREASLWTEAASESEIERATYPAVAQEARARGLVPLRMGKDPIWHHPETGEKTVLAPAHAGGSGLYSRIPNDLAELKRRFPTAEETARRERTPEEMAAQSDAAAAATRTKKQEAVDAAKRARDQKYGPFNLADIRAAFDLRSEKARIARPRDTVEDFAERLSALPRQTRQQIHRSTFPERYK